MYMEERGLRGFLAAAVLQEVCSLGLCCIRLSFFW